MQRYLNIQGNNSSSGNTMYEKSVKKKNILDALIKWDYNAFKATPYQIARKVSCSESSATKILRYLKDQGVVNRNSKGSWHLI
jgi:ribosomal protein S25